MSRAAPGRKCRGKNKGKKCRHITLCEAQGPRFCLLAHNARRVKEAAKGGGKKNIKESSK